MYADGHVEKRSYSELKAVPKDPRKAAASKMMKRAIKAKVESFFFGNFIKEDTRDISLEKILK